jgi:MFS superfamily sulfate permease-like transporter
VLRERGGRFELVIYFSTIVVIVCTDLLKGVLFGLGLAVAKVVWIFTHLRVHIERQDDAKKTTVKLEGSATFLRLPELTSALASVASDHEVHVQLSVNYIDHASMP